MNAGEDHLKRLFKSASLAPRVQPGTLPFAIEARVLAQWRALPREFSIGLLLPLLRQAFICACVVMAATLATLSLLEMPGQSADVWTVSNAFVNLALLQ